MKKQWNVLFVFPDQLAAAWMGAYGNPEVETPNLTNFARSSTLFREAYTASPLCTPFRGTLFTGRYPCQTGIMGNRSPIPPGEATLSELFNKGGYHTSYVGKWHLAGTGGATWVPPGSRAGFQDFIGWECSHIKHWNEFIWEDDPETPIVMDGHETDALTEIACRRLKALPQENPFCMFLSYQAPHAPCIPPEEYHDLYRSKSLQLPPNVHEDAVFHRPDWGEENVDVHDFRRRYFAEVTHLDAAFGRLLATLEETGRADDTIVVFTSDHGEMAGCHGLFQKSVMYQESVQIPLIVRVPGAAPRETDVFFSSVDFMPTLLDLCGLPPAANAEGISYAPLLRGDAQEGRDHVIIQLHHLCIINRTHKLVTDAQAENMHALFDRSSDRYERRNLLMEKGKSNLGVATPMRDQLKQWLDDIMTRASCASSTTRQ